MRHIFLAVTAIATFATSQVAQATAGCELRSCAVTVTSDSGTTSRKCEGYYSQCTGEGGIGVYWSDYSYVPSHQSCPYGMSDSGKRHINGLKLCIDPLLGGLEKRESDLKLARSLAFTSLEQVFSPKTDEYKYFGWVSTSSATLNRSPNAGRAQSSHARLDICMGANDTDSAIATNNATTCYNQYCGTSYNEYCNANSAAVCQDRCECSINGQTHSTCNQL